MGREDEAALFHWNDHALRGALDSWRFVGSTFWLKEEQDLIDVSSLMRSRDRRLILSLTQTADEDRQGDY